MNESEGMAKFLDYQRSRVRIARATVFNLALAIPIGVPYLAIQTEVAPLSIVGFIVLGTLLMLLSFFASERIHAAWLGRLSDAYRIVCTGVGDQRVRNEVVAAVCYRVLGEDIEFLLVKTKDGKKWTFPKGHINTKKKERPWEAAGREAKEEAGAIGKPEKTPLTHYLYRTRSSKTAGQYRVQAYLLKVESQQPPEEAFRKPTWFSPSEACTRFAEGGREARHVKEHKRALRSALKRLKPPQ